MRSHRGNARTKPPEHEPEHGQDRQREGSATARDSRARMLDTTATLLQRQGYHATGLNQIVAESGSPKGSMYFHFPGGKEQLAAEAIELAGRRIVDALHHHSRESALASLDSYLAWLARWLERTHFEQGCPIATVALEVGPTSALVGQACADAFDRLEGAVVEWLRADGYEEAHARDRAVLIYAAIEGALVLAKGRRSTEPLHRLRAALPQLLGDSAST